MYKSSKNETYLNDNNFRAYILHASQVLLPFPPAHLPSHQDIFSEDYLRGPGLGWGNLRVPGQAEAGWV